MKQLGGFSTVLAALGQGVSIEPNLLVHALGLFSNLMPTGASLAQGL